MMKDLIHKYKKNELTPEELRRLREEIASASSSAIEEIVRKDWENDSCDNLQKDISYTSDLERIWERIDRETSFKEHTLSWRKVLNYAAVFLLPVLLLSTFYFYHEARAVSGQKMVVRTEKGEHADILLPDGTSVNLNVSSELSYNPADFNKKTRNVDFIGEGFFRVARNTEVPFVISSQELQLEVLGTEFNFRSRVNQTDIEVMLEKGHVMLYSGDKCVELFENETAVYDKQSGTFSVERNSDEPVYWLRKELHFQNTSFSDLIRTLEAEYDVHFEWSGCKHHADDCFSGILPSSDLRSVLEILRKSYGFEYKINADTVIVVCSLK